MAQWLSICLPRRPPYQCGPGSIPGLGVICGLSLLYSGFPLSSKTNISKFQFDLESEGHKFISLGLLRATLVKQTIYLFIYLCRHHGHVNLPNRLPFPPTISLPEVSSIILNSPYNFRQVIRIKGKIKKGDSVLL